MRFTAPLRLALLSAFLALPSASAQDIDAGPPPAVVAVPAAAPAAVLDGGVGSSTTLPPLPAAPNLDTADGIPQLIGAISDAVVNKDWGKLIFVLVTAVVWGLRKFLGPKWAFMQSKLAGIILTFVVSFAGMLATSWAPGAALNAKAVLTALYMGFLAAGGWSILKNLWEHFAQKGSVAPAPVPPKP